MDDTDISYFAPFDNHQDLPFMSTSAGTLVSKHQQVDFPDAMPQ